MRRAGAGGHPPVLPTATLLSPGSAAMTDVVIASTARTAVGSIGESPFVQATKAERIDVEFDRKILYELDGGDRKEVKRLKVKVKPGALRVRVPAESTT